MVVKCGGGTTCITHLYLECLLCARLYSEQRIGCLHAVRANRCVHLLPPGTIGTSQRRDSFGLMGQIIIFVSSHSEFCEVKVIVLIMFSQYVCGDGAEVKYVGNELILNVIYIYIYTSIPVHKSVHQ